MMAETGRSMTTLAIRLATGARAVAAVVALGVGGSLLFRLSPYARLKTILNHASLPEETITSPGRLAEILDTLGVAGRELYLQFQAWDVVNPLLICLAGAMLLGWLLKRAQRTNSKWRVIIWLPVAMLAADLLENLVLSVAVGAYPDPVAIVNALPLVTTIKFGAAIATGMAVVLLALLWLRDTLRGTR